LSPIDNHHGLRQPGQWHYEVAVPGEPTTPFLSASWAHLLMLNYEVPAEVLQPHVPRGTTLDTLDGRCLASLVGFQFLDTRVRGIAIPMHRDFEEVNLRFYVRRDTDEGPRRGVVFIKEIVPRRAIAWAARALYNERYVALPMWHEDRLGTEGGELRYGFAHAGERCTLGATAVGTQHTPAPESEPAFIAEHYYGYSRQRDGSTVEYRVDHPPWALWDAREPVLQCDVGALYGAEWSPHLHDRPSSCFVAVGSEVVVHRGVRLHGSR